MSNMSQKSVDARRHRRTRYKRACRPLMEKYKLTAMQVAPFIERVVAEDAQLRYKIVKVEEELESVIKRLKELEASNEEMVAKLKLYEEG